MAKITDNDYFLPQIEALLRLDSFYSGTTQPMLIRGICSKTHEKNDYVIKYKSSQRMSIHASCRELIAALIAKELTLHVVEPVLINVSEKFVESTRGFDGYKAASGSLGVNFGTVYMPSYMTFVNNQIFNANQLKQAENIFAFDVFISNADRRVEKPNLLSYGDNILIFDHEMAFGFVNSIIKNPTPWILDKYDEEMIKGHYFYKLIKQNGFNFDGFIEELSVLDKNFWDKLAVLVPDEWMSPQFDQIKMNLSSIIGNRISFLKELNNILS